MLAPKRGNGVQQREARPHRAFGVVLVRARIAEIDGGAVAHPFGNVAVKARHRSRDRALRGSKQVGHIFRIELGRQGRQADQVAEHDRHVSPLGALP
jgi:hypothetical protein